MEVEAKMDNMMKNDTVTLAHGAGGRQTSLSTDELEAKIEEISGGKFRRL